MLKFVCLVACLVATSFAHEGCNVFLKDEESAYTRSSLKEVTPEALKSEVTFLTEFARFMNNQAPRLLEEFAESKRIFEANKQHQMPNFMGSLRSLGLWERKKRQATTAAPVTTVAPASNTTKRPVGEIGQAAANLTTQIVDAFAKPAVNVLHIIQDVVSSVGQAIQSNVSPSAWKYICFATWFPLHEKHCPKVRCAVCSPAVMSAAAACKKADVEVNHKCVQDVMGEGFCNICTAELLNL